MSYFKLENNKFKIFIKNSQTDFENQFYEPDLLHSNVVEVTIKDPIPPSVKRIIKNLDILTQDDKIIWFKDFDGFFSGVVVKDCGFSNFKITIEDKDFARFDDFGLDKLNDFEPICRINLIKDSITAKKVEYLISLIPDSDEMTNLLRTIETKLIQESN